MNIKQIIGFLSVSLLILTNNCFGMDSNIKSGNLEIYNDSPNPIIVDIRDDRDHNVHHFELPANHFKNEKLGFPITSSYMDYTILIFRKPESSGQKPRLVSKFSVINVTKNNNVILDIRMPGNISHLFPSKPVGKGKKSRGGLSLENNIVADNIKVLQR